MVLSCVLLLCVPLQHSWRRDEAEGDGNIEVTCFEDAIRSIVGIKFRKVNKRFCHYLRL